MAVPATATSATTAVAPAHATASISRSAIRPDQDDSAADAAASAPSTAVIKKPLLGGAHHDWNHLEQARLLGETRLAGRSIFLVHPP
jgi:hypothetical protein